MFDDLRRLTDLLDEAAHLADALGDAETHRALRDARAALGGVAPPFAVDLLAGRIEHLGRPLRLAPHELALLVALALVPRGLAPEELAERLRPAASGDAFGAESFARVYVHRTRRRLGTHETIRFVGGRYVLGDGVDVDLARVERDVAALERGGAGDPAAQERLRRYAVRLSGGRPAHLAGRLWFLGFEARLLTLEGRIANLRGLAGRFDDELDDVG